MLGDVGSVRVDDRIRRIHLVAGTSLELRLRGGGSGISAISREGDKSG
jgi:hypothetical protein